MEAAMAAQKIRMRFMNHSLVVQTAYAARFFTSKWVQEAQRWTN
jgi:hypothetical protein